MVNPLAVRALRKASRKEVIDIQPSSRIYHVPDGVLAGLNVGFYFLRTRQFPIYHADVTDTVIKPPCARHLRHGYIHRLTTQRSTNRRVRLWNDTEEQIAYADRVMLSKT
jgi:hypothetical protein